MRSILLSLAFMLVVAAAAPSAGSPTLTSATGTRVASAADDFQNPVKDKDINVDININQGGSRWYQNPMWLAIGGVAVLVVLLLVVLAARGGGTTIVKD